MKKRTWGLLAGAGAAVAAVVYLVTRGGGAPEPEPPPPGKANLYGRVKDEDTGKGLEGVLVYLDGMQTLTNEDGDYTLADLDPGDYTLGFAKENYTTISGDVTLEEGNNEINVGLIPAGQTVSFLVKLANIPDYASSAFQWFIDYGGSWGMEDPQEGIWTPIDEPIAVTGPRVGTLRAYLTAGGFQTWNFDTYQTWEEGETFEFSLSEEQPEQPPPPPEQPEEEYTGQIELRHLQISAPEPGVEYPGTSDPIAIITGFACIPGSPIGQHYCFEFYIPDTKGGFSKAYGTSGVYIPPNRNTTAPAGCYEFVHALVPDNLKNIWSETIAPGVYPIYAGCISWTYQQLAGAASQMVPSVIWQDRDTGLKYHKE